MAVIGIVATLKVKPGQEDTFKKIFTELRAKVKANEPGCLQYDFFKLKDEPTFVVMEQYASQDALTAHGQSEYFKASGPTLGAVLDGRPTLQFLDKVE